VKKPIFEDDELGNNPFVGTDFKVLVRTITDGSKYQMDDEVLVPSVIELEKDDYVKLYIKPEYRKLVGMLSNSSRSLLLWCIYELDSAKDYVWVNRDRYMEEHNVRSVNTVKGAIKELVQVGILSPTVKKGVYWINPRLFFHGSRVNKYPKNVVKNK
jgi:hypothetical protein